MMMTPHDILYLTLPFVGVGVSFGVHIALARWQALEGYFMAWLFGFCSGAAFVVGAHVYLLFLYSEAWGDILAMGIVNLCMFVLFGFCYFSLFHVGVSSLRARIFEELQRSPNGLTREELLDRYSARTMLDTRLARLIRGGQLVYAHDRYFLGKPHILIYTRFEDILRWIVLGIRLW
mgnify:CR=1 FL=1